MIIFRYQHGFTRAVQRNVLFITEHDRLTQLSSANLVTHSAKSRCQRLEILVKMEKVKLMEVNTHAEFPTQPSPASGRSACRPGSVLSHWVNCNT